MNGKTVPILLVVIAFLMAAVVALLGVIWRDSGARVATIETSVTSGAQAIKSNTVEIALDKNRIVKLEIAVRVLNPEAKVGP